MSQPQLTLVTLGGAFGLQNVSPFCLKAEMLMTHMGLDYTMEVQADPRKAPKGKLPYLLADGQVIADSELIVEYLDGITQGGVYGGLSAKDRAVGVALSRLVDDHLYWLMVASRWLDKTWFPNVVEGFFHIVPRPFRGFVAKRARKEVDQTYYLQGLGRHTQQEQEGFARRDLQALADAVGSQGFLFGDAPCVFDYTIASFMAGVYDQQPPTWITHLAEEFTGLKDYTERVQASVGVYGRQGEASA
jgi:glutathione S-transferase